MKVKVEGDERLTFAVMFAVRTASGKNIPCNVYHVKTFMQAEDLISDFLEVRRFLIKKGVASSSQYLFGGSFKLHSWEWMACHQVKIKVIDKETNMIIDNMTLPQPYLEAICNHVN